MKWIMASLGFCLARLIPSVVPNAANEDLWQMETVLCTEHPFKFFCLLLKSMRYGCFHKLNI